MNRISIIRYLPISFPNKFTASDKGDCYENWEVGRYDIAVFKIRRGPWWRRRWEYFLNVAQWVDDSKTGRPLDIAAAVARRRDEKKGVPSSADCLGAGVSVSVPPLGGGLAPL